MNHSLPVSPFPIELGDGFELDTIGTVHAMALYQTIDQNRDYLGAYDPYFFNDDTMSPGAILNGIKHTLAEAAQGHNLTCGIWHGNEFIGRLGIRFIPNPPGDYVRIAYWIIPGYRGCGVVVRAIRALFKIIAQENLATTAWATIEHGNEASFRVASKLGFELQPHPPTELATLIPNNCVLLTCPIPAP